MLLVRELGQCGRAHYPELSVHPRLAVLGVGVDPDVGRTVDGLGPQGRGDERELPEVEFDQVELLGGHPFPFHSVVVSGGALVEGAPDHRVGPLDNVPKLPEVPVLPLDELPEGWVNGPELPPPVDGEPRVLHHLAAHFGVVGGQVLGLGELLDFAFGNAVGRECPPS